MGRSITETPEQGKSKNAGESTTVIMQSTPGDAGRVVYLHSNVDENSISQVIATLIALANMNQESPIHLVVSTYGGAIDEMFALYDVIRMLPCPVRTIGVGKIMSAGVLLLASGEKGTRLIGETTRVMIHPVSNGAQGTVFEVANEATEGVRLQRLLVETLASETKMSVKKVESLMKLGYDRYVLPKEAIELGIVDKVMRTKR